MQKLNWIWLIILVGLIFINQSWAIQCMTHIVKLGETIKSIAYKYTGDSSNYENLIAGKNKKGQYVYLKSDTQLLPEEIVYIIASRIKKTERAESYQPPVDMTYPQKRALEKETISLSTQFHSTASGKDLYSKKDLQLMIRRFFKGCNPDLAIAIFYAESELDPNSIGDEQESFWHNGNKYGRSIGLAQIRTGGPGLNSGKFWDRAQEWGMSVKEFEEKLKDPIFNLTVARRIFDKKQKETGNGFLAWSAFTNASYKAHKHKIMKV